MGILFDAVRGGAAGAAATWVMDQVTTAMLDKEPPDVREREAEARPNGQSAVANLVDRLEANLGQQWSDEQRTQFANVVHYGLGVVPGALYGALRGRVTLVGIAGGLGYGALLWAFSDEYLNTRLGLSAPPEDYPSETHLRGLVGHLVLGSMTNSGIEALGG